MWPENLAAYQLFDRVATQWRAGMNGPIGLDYGAAYPVMERMRLSDAEWLDMLDDLRVMEQAAMATISENNSEA